MGEDVSDEKGSPQADESAPQKKLDAIKLLLESRKDKTPLEDAPLALL